MIPSTIDAAAGGMVGCGAGVVCAAAGNTGASMRDRTAAAAAVTRVFIVMERTPVDSRFPPMRLAATVMVVRQADGGLEVFLLRRSSKSAFMPDAFVFPGGTVDQADYAQNDPAGWDAARLRAEFRATVNDELPPDQAPVTTEQARAIVHAAVRELAEEASLHVAPAELRLFSHWITPESEPRRYNTFFFVAAAPHGQEGSADRVETHDGRWISPDEALAAAARGDLRIIYPTLKHLERLAAFRSVDALLAYAGAKPIVTVMPRGLPEDGFRLPAGLEAHW
jgi:8-oxo-dGTP pyrophosphatase MutT (NUDIX family)